MPFTLLASSSKLKFSRATYRISTNFLKVTVHLPTDHFVEILIFRLMYRSKHELSSKKKFSKILNIGKEMAVLSFGRKLKLPVWLAYLVLFSRINFFTWSGHCKKLKLIGNLSHCPQILRLVRLTHKQQKHVCEFFLSKYFFDEIDHRQFCTNTLYFSNPIWKIFCNFSLKLNMANGRNAF